MQPEIFVFLGALAIAGALGVVLQRNPVHSLLSLVMTLVVVAVLFMDEDAMVVGFLQIIVYAGAIMVLFLFVIWLLNLQVEVAPSRHLGLKLAGAIGAALLAAQMWRLLSPAQSESVAAREPLGYGSLVALSDKLFTNYLVAFEATSVLLLAAVVGAVAVARRLPRESGASEDAR